jgi:hypothetical protein
MICSDVRDRLPEENPEILQHVHGCDACRGLRESYRLDLLLLQEGFLDLAAPKVPEEFHPPTSRSRRLIPLAAAAAMILGIFTLVLRPAPPRKKAPEPAVVGPVEQGDAEMTRRRSEALRNLADTPVRRAQVVATSTGSGMVSISIGKTGHVQEGDEFAICRRGVFIAKVVVTRAEELSAQAEVAFREAEPRLGDDVFDSVPIAPAERKAALDYLFSFRPAEEKDQARVDAGIEGLGSPDASVRKNALKDLLAQGAPARRRLEKPPSAGFPEAAKPGITEVLDRWAGLEDLLGGPGVERDLEYLASVDDPRAYDRLKRILSVVRPFSKEGFPERGSGLAPALRVWWEGNRARVLWNADADRYEEKNP